MSDDKPPEEMISMDGAKLIEDKPTYTPYKPKKQVSHPRLYNCDAHKWEGGDQGPIFDFNFWPNWVPDRFRDLAFTLALPIGLIILMIWLSSLGKWFSSFGK